MAWIPVSVAGVHWNRAKEHETAPVAEAKSAVSAVTEGSHMPHSVRWCRAHQGHSRKPAESMGLQRNHGCRQQRDRITVSERPLRTGRSHDSSAWSGWPLLHDDLSLRRRQVSRSALPGILEPGNGRGAIAFPSKPPLRAASWAHGGARCRARMDARSRRERRRALATNATAGSEGSPAALPS